MGAGPGKKKDPPKTEPVCPKHNSQKLEKLFSIGEEIRRRVEARALPGDEFTGEDWNKLWREYKDKI